MLKLHARVIEDIKDIRGNVWFSVGEEVVAISQPDGRFVVKHLPTVKKFFSMEDVDAKHLKLEN